MKTKKPILTEEDCLEDLSIRGKDAAISLINRYKKVKIEPPYGMIHAAARKIKDKKIPDISFKDATLQDMEIRGFPIVDIDTGKDLEAQPPLNSDGAALAEHKFDLDLSADIRTVAEFMNGKISMGDGFQWKLNDINRPPVKSNMGDVLLIIHANNLEYHSSWGWFMPVWFKFRDLQFDVKEPEYSKNIFWHSHAKDKISHEILFGTIETSFKKMAYEITIYNRVK